MVKAKKSRKREEEKSKNRRWNGCSLIDTMDFVELERIRARKKLMEKAGRLPGQESRTLTENILFFMSRARFVVPTMFTR